ncbi:ABC transporter substrate-binding protein [Vulcanimicrobium alpinum]|uniref:ABC transporter substrate-binding protein n=1 Tax=Vulcanimicrobium alpinum TaxID=3016050 RepID=A0AAN1XVU3_UNVUL|nr:ABC transporter substrate-binding protein [Vulcanimicrobium alpinum]BDE06347.1 ABC transporter substrate-binding protein [Vulcanimicrobium alpinum]
MRRFPALPLLALALAASGCGGGSAAKAGSGPLLVMARVKDAVVLDPSHATDGLSLNVTNEVMQNIVGLKPGSFEIVGEIARSWSVSDDGRTWTFELRPGLQFSDGTAADAAAVKFNLDRWRLRSHPAHGSFAYPYYASVFGGFPGAIVDVRAPSPTRLVIGLASPRGSFLHDLADQAFGIGSPAAISADPKGFELKPVGSGPYMVAEWVRDDHITLVANPKWAGKKPGYPTVLIRDIPDQATSVLSLEKGDIDMLTDPRPEDAKTLAAKGIALALQPANNTSYIAPETEKKPFGDPRVRQAIAYAIDKEAMVAHLYAKGAMVANDWLPPGMLGDNPALKAYPHDVARAKALLAAAGYPHGFSTTLSYPTSPRPYLPDPPRVAETLQSDLRAAGIEVTLQPSEFGVFLDKVRHGEHELALIGWTGDNGDPDNFLYPLLDQDSARKDGTAQNYSFWRDPAYHELMLAGQRTNDPAKRAAIYRKALVMIHDLAPAIPLVHTTVPVALKPTIKGFVPSPNTAYHFVLIQPPAGS